MDGYVHVFQAHCFFSSGSVLLLLWFSFVVLCFVALQFGVYFGLLVCIVAFGNLKSRHVFVPLYLGMFCIHFIPSRL